MKCYYLAGEGASHPSDGGQQANGMADAAAENHSAQGAAENGGPQTLAAAGQPEANGHAQHSAEAASPAEEILLIPADAGIPQTTPQRLPTSHACSRL